MKKRICACLLAACALLGLAPAALAREDAPETRVVLEAGAPDSAGCFTVEMRIYNARFNAFQFVLWYDGATVVPVDASGAETDRFSAFAQPEDDGWMATVGTAIDPEQGLIDFTGYVTPGASAAVDAEPETGVALVGESGLSLFTFRFKKVGGAPVVLKLATEGGGTPYQPYLPEGGAVVDAGVSAPVTLELIFPAGTGESGTVEVPLPETSVPPEVQEPEETGLSQETPDAEETGAPGQEPAGPTVEELLDGSVILELGSHAALVEGGVTAIYPGERSVTAYAHDNRTFVPVRFVAERLGARVGWENGTQTVVVEKDGHTVRMAVGSQTYTLDGEERAMDVPAELQTSTGGNSRTMVPIRFVTEALDYQVEWDQARNLVIVADPSLGWDPAGEAESRAMDEAVSRLALYGGFV